MSAEGTRRAIIAAFLANLGIAISKFFAFAVTGSASMLAEAIHSVADTGNQGLLFLGGKRSRKAPTDEHPFGFGTERYFWAFVVALVLFTLGSLFALYEGVHKLLDPKELDSPIWAFTVLGKVVRTVKGGLFAPPGMGVRFVDLSPGDRQTILDYVARRSPQFAEAM